MKNTPHTPLDRRPILEMARQITNTPNRQVQVSLNELEFVAFTLEYVVSQLDVADNASEEYKMQWIHACLADVQNWIKDAQDNEDEPASDEIEPLIWNA